jgi:hypothetical protein
MSNNNNQLVVNNQLCFVMMEQKLVIPLTAVKHMLTNLAEAQINS